MRSNLHPGDAFFLSFLPITVCSALVVKHAGVAFVRANALWEIYSASPFPPTHYKSDPFPQLLFHTFVSSLWGCSASWPPLSVRGKGKLKELSWQEFLSFLPEFFSFSWFFLFFLISSLFFPDFFFLQIFHCWGYSAPSPYCWLCQLHIEYCGIPQ